MRLVHTYLILVASLRTKKMKLAAHPTQHQTKEGSANRLLHQQWSLVDKTTKEMILSCRQHWVSRKVFRTFGLLSHVSLC